jgi:cytochrome c oxidase subunit 3
MPVITEEPKTDAAEGTLAERVGTFPDTGSPGGPPSGGSGGGGSGGGGGGASPERYIPFPVSKERLVMWLVLTGITMLFAGLASAYIITSHGPSWQAIALPQLLWANTFVLLASSVTIERTRLGISRNDLDSARVWIAVTGILGLAFLIGQLWAWRQLVEAGIYLPSALQGSFFYLLTGLHGLHLLGGLAALGYVWVQIFRSRYSAARHEPVSLAAMYWHFMDGLWVSVFLLLILA